MSPHDREADGHAARRPQWRGERQALLVRVPAPAGEAVRGAAAAAGTSISDFVANLIQQFLATDPGTRKDAA